MIFVDTSVWVDFFRGRNRSRVEPFLELLDNDSAALAIPVYLEILMGSSSKDRPRLQRLLRALPVFYPTDSTWRLMEAWIEKAASAGHRFGVGDLLIAATAAENSGTVWSFDQDFVRLETLGFIQLYT